MSGTISIEPETAIQPGERRYFNLPDFGHDLPKDGWLAKRGPWSGVVFDSYVSFRIHGYADGMDSPVPADSARTLDSNTVTSFVAVEVPSSAPSAVDPANDDLSIILFGPSEREQDSREQNSLQFSPQGVLADVIPGVSTSRHG